LEKFSQFFKKLGLRDNFEPEDYAGLLNTLKDKYGDSPLNERDLKSAICAVNLLGKSESVVTTEAYIPDTKGVLINANDAIYNDANWMATTAGKFPVHYFQYMVFIFSQAIFKDIVWYILILPLLLVSIWAGGL
jgi:hypothetical protein